MEKNQKFFQALHSPIGANAGFALGMKEDGGGFVLEQDRISRQNVWIGYDTQGELKAFPFSDYEKESGRESYCCGESAGGVLGTYFTDEEIEREFNYATDTFRADRISFSLMNRTAAVPDPEEGGEQEMKEAVLPAIAGKLTLDNRTGQDKMTGFFAVSGIPAKMFLKEKTSGRLLGVVSKSGYGFAVSPKGNLKMEETCDFSLEDIFRRPRPVLTTIAGVSGLLFTVEKGERAEIDIVFGWYQAGTVTGGLHECRYYYTSFFDSLEEVLEFALSHREMLWEEAGKGNRMLLESGLSLSRQFLLAQSVKSYYVSSMLLEEQGRVRWVMNEGSFRMLNTFDLIVDHMFFDLRFHPWTLKNQLDSYAEDYCYRDRYGISFTHDQGSQNIFSRKGISGYETPDLSECFSYMTQEELCNWLLAAAVFHHQTGDGKWLEKNIHIVRECLESMKQRCGETGDGIMDVDSDLCGIGAEITTYDSLDPGLGLARRNVYMAVKSWASYLAAAAMLDAAGQKEKDHAQEARELATRCAAAVNSYFDPERNCFPAILDHENQSKSIPAVEALVYPVWFGQGKLLWEDGEYRELTDNLRNHLQTVLTDGCVFEDGGWKLSEHSSNSWMSKIFLCQYVAEEVLGVEYPREKADEAHEMWWKEGCASDPGIDQIISGGQKERGFHYPRAVTSILWLTGNHGSNGVYRQK